MGIFSPINFTELGRRRKIRLNFRLVFKGDIVILNICILSLYKIMGAVLSQASPKKIYGLPLTWRHKLIGEPAKKC